MRYGEWIIKVSIAKNDPREALILLHLSLVSLDVFTIVLDLSLRLSRIQVHTTGHNYLTLALGLICSVKTEQLKESSRVKQSLKISIDLHYNGHNSFYSSLMKMTDYYDFRFLLFNRLG